MVSHVETLITELNKGFRRTTTGGALGVREGVLPLSRVPQRDAPKTRTVRLFLCVRVRISGL